MVGLYVDTDEAVKPRGPLRAPFSPPTGRAKEQLVPELRCWSHHIRSTPSSERAQVDEARRTLIDYYNNPEYVLDSRAHAQKGGRVDTKLRILGKFITAGPVLELGGGAGLYAGRLPGYIGVDISLEAIRHAGAGRRHMICGDIQALPLANESVAGVFSFNVLEHIPRPDAVMEEIDRVLMKGGTVMLKDSWERASLSTRASTPKWLLKVMTGLGSRVRMLRRFITRDTRVEYRVLVPDYTRIGNDFDAVAGIDEFSVFAFFQSRGYACLNLRRSLLLRLLSPYSDHRHWVIVRKHGAAPPSA